jgi:diguanylate cyclase
VPDLALHTAGRIVSRGGLDVSRLLFTAAAHNEDSDAAPAGQSDDRQALMQALTDTRAALAQARAELLLAQEELKSAHHKALHDALTSLPNRSFFDQRLASILGASEPPHHMLAVFFLDLDGFKSLNDTHGHDVGDQVLRIVATRLARAVRAEDFVSRIGGDEFACLLPESSDRQRMARFAGELFEAISAPARLGSLELCVRPSIGIAIYPADGVTTEALLRSADAAMYRAKRRNGGYAFFEDCADGDLEGRWNP